MSDDRDGTDGDDSEEGSDAETPFEVIDEPETGDPFDRFDVEDRDADPFERIEAPDAPTATDADPVGDASGRDDPPAAEPTADDGREAGEESAVEPDDADRSGEPGIPGTPDDSVDPFDGLDRDGRAGDPFEGLRDRSPDEEDTTRPDADLWEELSRREAEPDTETHGRRRFAEVSKHTYCERCEHFSEPPSIACAHEGTDIIEFVDFATVRVADCPVVAEREQLADMDRER